ncbi:Uncharacterised protein [Corynebacterium kutscheri]|uniref:Transcriptional regulator n=1 Tax=Corynebacterium kutscheri TaxID=35755 RepID=A0AB38VW51_9CORY|nr:Uncharacterised protein [Corynebacterium kutscheri]VEH10409.1 Uncharacterised protein [Corynebacterium kutscheri]VEH81959.1 Uncharacterised protein [Corynebacterium kutscheri]
MGTIKQPTLLTQRLEILKSRGMLVDEALAR